jgi:flagellar biosynthesis protein
MNSNRHNKPREQAVALSYDEQTESAPKVVAKGKGILADKIRSIAREYGIPVHRDDALVELLAQIDIDREIPPELYTAIAELLAWIYRANTDMRKDML